MIDILKIDHKDMKTIMPKVFAFMEHEFQSVEGSYYKYGLDGKEYIFNRQGPRIVVMWEDEGEFLYTSFYINDYYEIIMIESENYYVDVTDTNMVFYEKGTSMVHYITVITDVPQGVYNAKLTYSQWNKDNDARVTLFYDYMYDEEKTNRIYPHHIEIPQSISLTKKGSVVDKFRFTPLLSRKYVLIKSLPSDTYYNFFAKEANEEQGNMLKRYLRWYGRGDAIVTLFPFGKFWKEEEINEEVIKAGFKSTIPEEIIDIVNNGFPDYDEYMDIAQKLHELDIAEKLEEKGEDHVEKQEIVLGLKK